MTRTEIEAALIRQTSVIENNGRSRGCNSNLPGHQVYTIIPFTYFHPHDRLSMVGWATNTPIDLLHNPYNSYVCIDISLCAESQGKMNVQCRKRTLKRHAFQGKYVKRIKNVWHEKRLSCCCGWELLYAGTATHADHTEDNLRTLINNMENKVRIICRR